MENNGSPIGICDWGIGGLGFYRLLLSERPDIDTIYVGDQAAQPYGLMSRGAIVQRMNRVFRFLRGQGVHRVIVACNAAGTVIESVRISGIAASSVIKPTISRLLVERPARVGVIGGVRAIRSLAYAQPLRDSGMTVIQRVAQPLSALIEAGNCKGPEAHALLNGVLKPLHGVDCLVLACTHYAASESIIRKLLPDVTIVDPAEETWKHLKSELTSAPDGTGDHRFYSTGDTDQMRRQAAAVFHVDSIVERCEL